MPAWVGPALAGVLAEHDAPEPEWRTRLVTGLLPEVASRWFGVRQPRAARHSDEEGRVPVYLVPQMWATDGPMDLRKLDEPRALAESVERVTGQPVRVLPASASVSGRLTPAELREVVQLEELGAVELDPLREVAQLDTALVAIGLAAAGRSLRSAAGVRVAVLDGGIDATHPDLQVTDAVSTCDIEDIRVPSDHGTHVAGCLASRNQQFLGVAPDVELVDVKVTTASRLSQQKWFSDGVDEALVREVDILVVSLGWSHLPSAATPGWACPIVMPDGLRVACVICRAAETAVADGRLVVVAAGNDHTRAEQLRTAAKGGAYDTELCCPGQAEGVLCVGAVDDSGSPAPFSSNGPGSRGAATVTLVAPGVEVSSTVCVGGANPAAAFRAMSGTSQAAPLVAGALAITLAANGPRDRARARADLLRDCVVPVPGPSNVVGAGRLDLTALVEP